MKLHHIGYVVRDIKQYEQNLIFRRKLKTIQDPVQKAVLTLYESWSNVFIELIQPLHDTSFTYSFLQKNKHAYHHLCYAVKNVEEMRQVAENYKLLLFKGPVKAPLFEEKEVYFFFDRNKEITEFLIEP